MNRQLPFWLVSFALFGIVLSPARAESVNAMTNPIPSTLYFPVPNGILFPSLSTAAGVNAAAIPLKGKLTALQGAYTPSSNSNADTYFGSITESSKDFGINAAYEGVNANHHLTNGGFAGAGYNINPVSLGVGVRDSNFDAHNNEDVDIGMIYSGQQGLTLGGVFYNVNHDTQLDMGVGYNGGKNYNLEADLLLPPFNNGGSDTAVTVAGTVYASQAVGLSFRASYWTQPKLWQETVGGVVVLSKVVSAFAQFTNPSIWTAGLTVLW